MPARRRRYSRVLGSDPQEKTWQRKRREGAMPSNSDRKRKIRERMVRTGEKYTTAMRAIDKEARERAVAALQQAAGNAACEQPVSPQPVAEAGGAASAVQPGATGSRVP